MSVTVVIPWRPGCPHREAALEYVVDWWTTHHPRYPIVLGTHQPDTQWRKGCAVDRALDEVDTTHVVISDADVIVPGVNLAVVAVEQGYAWAAPFRTVLRLSPLATTQVYADRRLPDEPVPTSSLADRYVGQPGGGMVVLPIGTARTIPIDPRFEGWGQEDLSWARALYVLAGGPWRSPSSLYHLWHPPMPRISPGIGSHEGLDLFMRYRKAVHTSLMAPIVDEARRALAELG
jgi:hypothetical protein